MANTTVSRSPLVDHLTTALITTAFATLTAAFVWSSNYLLHLGENVDAVTANVDKVFAEEKLKADRANEFFIAVQSAMKRSERRQDQSLQLVEAAEHRSVAADEYHKWANRAVLECTQDEGLLSGFSPETTGVPPAYNNAVVNYFKSEISVWRSEDNLMKSLARGKLPPSSVRQEFQAWQLDRAYAGSLLVSTAQDMIAERKLQVENEREIYDAAHRQFQSYRKWSMLATFGLAFSIIGFYIALRVVFAQVQNRSRPSSSSP